MGHYDTDFNRVAFSGVLNMSTFTIDAEGIRSDGTIKKYQVVFGAGEIRFYIDDNLKWKISADTIN